MLEEMNVEKKNVNRSGQGPAKGICTESKKTQDPSNGIKTFSKNARKRENFLVGNGSKLDQNRKPLTQKGKTFDKRLYYKSRTQCNACGTEGLQMRDDEYDGPDLDGFFLPETKKQNYNFLLKFHYAPRGENSNVWKMPRRGQQTFSTRALMATHAHKYNKEEFLQATCQFVVREGVDYTANLFNPDILVDWQHIELIVTGSSETVISCPICLYPPTAAKMSRCGHIFCWRCILHYLALSDKTWRKCPICFESVHEKDLKSAVCLNKTLYQVGDKILLKLMKSEKGRPVVCPIREWSSRERRPILSYGEHCLDTVYSKLLVASKKQILDIINRDYLELQSQVEEFKGCPEICFVEKALELLANRKSQVEIINEAGTGINNIISSEALEENKTEVECRNSVKEDALNQGLEITKDNICDNASSSSLLVDTSVMSNEEKTDGDVARSSCEVENENVTAGNVNVPTEDVKVISEDQFQSSSNTSKYYYFYQASDGQEIYLNKINVRMLEMAFGSLENCPSEIQGKILEKETGSMTHELRKRFRYFSHLPITTTFEIVELDIKDLVCAETLAHFEETLYERQKRRQHVAKKEKQREKKIEEEVRSQYLRSSVPAPTLKIESRYDFPECGTATEDFRALCDDYPAISEVDYSGLAYSPEEDIGLERTRGAMGGLAIGREEAAGVAPEEVRPSSSNEDTGGVSFAQMLRAGKGPLSRPGRGEGGGWGGRSSGGGTGTTSRRTRQPSVTSSLESAGEEDREFAAPTHPHSLSLTQLIRMAEASSEKGGQTTTSTGGNQRKKKKNQQKLLFSTGGLPKGI